MNARTLLNPGFIAALAVLGLAGAGMKAGIEHFQIYLQKKPIQPEPIGPLESTLRGIPTKTAHWIQNGQDVIERPDNLEVLGTTNYLTRQYVEKTPPAGGRPRLLQLHAAYYTGAIDTVPHVPERCFIGAGMTLTGGPWVIQVPMDTSLWVEPKDLPDTFKGRVYSTRLSNDYSRAGGRRVNLPVGLTPTDPLRLRISEYGSARGGHFLAGYFFIGNGGWVESAEDVRLLSFDLRQDYAYYMKVQVGSSDVATPEELAQLAGSLFDDLFGEIMLCTPDWMKVERGEWPPDNPKRIKTQDTHASPR